MHFVLRHTVHACENCTGFTLADFVHKCTVLEFLGKLQPGESMVFVI